MIKLSKKEREERRFEILQAYIKLALKTNFNTVTRRKLAAEMGVTAWHIHNYAGGVLRIERDALNYAITHKVYPIILQILTSNHTLISKISVELKKDAIKTL